MHSLWIVPVSPVNSDLQTVVELSGLHWPVSGPAAPEQSILTVLGTAQHTLSPLPALPTIQSSPTMQWAGGCQDPAALSLLTLSCVPQEAKATVTVNWHKLNINCR